MDEKTIAVGKIKTNSLVRWLLIIGAALCICGMICCSSSRFGFFESLILSGDNLVVVWCYPGILCLILGIFFHLMMSKCAITITDKRVIGNANFGKRVDLPLNQISSVGQGMLSSIAVATSSGKVSFWLLENRDEVFNSLSDLIKNFQIQKTDFKTNEAPILMQTSDADELKKYKDLLDTGVITQEEFDAKKKQLLGL